jgi:hypothetical protein
MNQNCVGCNEHGTLHVPDARMQSDFPTLGLSANWRTFLGVPLYQQGQFISGLFGRRAEVRPFTPARVQTIRNLWP